MQGISKYYQPEMVRVGRQDKSEVTHEGLIPYQERGLKKYVDTSEAC
jgi:hypothetical protein